MKFNAISKCYQRGLFIIGATIMVVIAVARGSVYYQSAQNEKKLDKITQQIMAVVSVVNGLYVGKTAGPEGRYHGLTTKRVADAMPNMELDTSTTYLKTPLPNIKIAVQGFHYDLPVEYIGRGGENYFALGILPKEGTSDLTVLVSLCQRFHAFNFNGQMVAFFIVDNFNGLIQMINTELPFKSKLAICQKLTKGHSLGLIFK